MGKTSINKQIALDLILKTKGLKNFDKVATSVDVLGKKVKKVTTTYEKWSKQGKETVSKVEKIIKGKKKLVAINEKLDKNAISPKQKKATRDRIKAENKAVQDKVKGTRELESGLNKSSIDSKKRESMLENAAAKGAKVISRNISKQEKDKERLIATEQKQINMRTNLDKINKQFGTTDRESLKLLSEGSKKWDKFGNVTDLTGKSIKNVTKNLDKGIGSLARFQMEHLGVMFAGMALNRTMANLSATSREWVGVGELMSTMMGVVMLPTTMDLLNFGVLPLFDALTNLPEGAKLAIGYVITALEGLGAVMMVGGQMMLGLDSTMTLLSKIAGVKPELIFTSKGLSALKTKMGPVVSGMKTLGKYAAAGILISVAMKDLGEGQVVAALGDGLAAAGILMGGPAGIAMMAVGVSLKLLGDEEFLVGAIKTMLKIGEVTTSIIKEAVIAGFTMRNFNVENIEGFANISRAFGRATEEFQQEMIEDGKIFSLSFPEHSINNVEEDMERLEKDYDNHLITEQEYNAGLEIEGKKRERIIDRYYSADLKLEQNIRDKREEKETSTSGALSSFSMLGFNPVRFIKNLLTEDEGNFAVGGKINKTGRYFLHEGEEVVNKNQTSSGVAMQVTYNVTVSDKREFEQMLRSNNEKLTNDVRRMSRV